MGIPTGESFAATRSGEPRSLTELLLERIALRHQIAVLKRSGTRRPCFRGWDRLFWILFSRWWPLSLPKIPSGAQFEQERALLAKWPRSETNCHLNFRMVDHDRDRRSPTDTETMR